MQNVFSGTLEFALITERTGFDALEAEWNALFARAGLPAQVFQTFNWNWHWANHYLGSSKGGIIGVELAIVTGRRGGKLVMVWPLVTERMRGITQAFSMGEPATQYCDVLIDDIPDQMDVLRAAFDFLSRNLKADLVRLRRVRADAMVTPLLQEIGALRSNKRTAPYLDLTRAKDFGNYEQTFTARSRSNRRRNMKRLRELGSVHFTRLTSGEKAALLVQEALELKTAWLKSRGLVSNAIGDKRLARFFAGAAGANSHPAGCIVTSLEVDGVPAAAEVLFQCKGRIAVHVMAYDLAYEKAGVGALLFEHGVREAYGAGMTAIDLLAPGDGYKLDWADASVEVLDWCRPLTLQGYAYAKLYLDFIRPRAQSAFAAMPASWRRLIASHHALA